METRKIQVIRRTVLSDSIAPMQLFLWLQATGQRPSLFESNEGGERWGQYTLLTARPRLRITWRDGVLLAESGSGQVLHQEQTTDPLVYVQTFLRGTELFETTLPDARPYSGPVPGLFGLLGYALMHAIEPKVQVRRDDSQVFADLDLVEPEVLYVYDNVRQLLHVQHVLEGDSPDAGTLAAVAEAMQTDLNAARAFAGPPMLVQAEAEPITPDHETEKASFLAAVEKARDAIYAGEVIQVVLAQRFSVAATVDPATLYRMLRVVNPSPYLFYLDVEGGALVGSSPEVMVRLRDGRIELRPIAGTRKRGRTGEEDKANEVDLLADPKELAEHLMLVDLGRNDVGRVAQAGTVEVPEKFIIERYSHVMHIVSQVEGLLGPDWDAVDLFRATFPAGTVSGAPKVRACELIHEFEDFGRGPYSGSVGYFDYRGNMDTCIVIRTYQHEGDRIRFVAGAGIVFDSVPENEFEETVNKARGLAAALASLGAQRGGSQP